MRSILLGIRRRRGGDQRTQTRLLLLLLLLLLVTMLPSISALDFLFNSFNASSDDLITLVGDAQVESTVLRLTNDSNQFSFGRAFLRSRIQMRPTSNLTAISSFSTSFVFSIVPEISTSPGFGLLFVLSNSTDPAGALSGQYLGIFSNATVPTAAPLIAVEFDVGRNPEFNDPDNNHVGIDLNNIESAETATAGYYNSTAGDLIPVNMRNGQNIHAWIEFDGPRFEINVTIAPIGVSRPSRPLLTFRDPVISNYLSSEMFVGFSASKTTWVETQRVLAWSFSDNGVARDINTTNLPVFTLNSSSSSLSPGAIAEEKARKRRDRRLGARILAPSILLRRAPPSHQWLLQQRSSRSRWVRSGLQRNPIQRHRSRREVREPRFEARTQREFMAEISSMGRLQHKNLVPMRGWCRKGNELLLVYDYMPNGSLNRWIFDKPKKLMNWDGRRKVLADVAEGLNYLHHGWDQVVIHRDIKSSNILLDGEMRGRTGDGSGGANGSERRVQLWGSGAGGGVRRKPIETAREREEEVVLIDWVREKYGEGKVWEAADGRIKGEYKAEEMEAVLKLGLACCHPNPVHRPTIREVVAVLVGGEVATATPRGLLSELVQGGSSIGSNCGGGGGVEVLLPEVPV
ncbi:concanavalin A-like lectin protein kinase family protein [Actinidia rufa]|uniref:non-specific serine/threonine protein kinase n=1 Tax=Actinidia rufa TaxID=165716 RepID=A0A7J0H2Z7_9ERIC|nr:concanavalin A-like lectin protein kinase family protein [Actinidia rufa]